jgi:hypothetical protein
MLKVNYTCRARSIIIIIIIIICVTSTVTKQRLCHRRLAKCRNISCSIYVV